ncbi:leukocyte elastase inhibitor-like isoform X3 [Phymastichus coffea]|uniref:leukocyte elastase inhibitor-like isoform X3 n=1 Tax=Phymastichus coffea TaxID=108790 RepID=UPI00273BABBB|nr:leukocyte elastase inhibitor-like isoform X3 [Phymastichus coffea]
MSDENLEALESVYRSVENFTNDFHENVAGKEKGNFVSSALSAHVVLSMAAYGARGTTAEGMKKALHLPAKDTDAYQGFQNFIDTFNNVQQVILKLANKIYTNSVIPVKDEYLKLTETYFRSQSESIDVSKPVEAAKIINQWCVEKTNGKITEILEAGDITPVLALVLLNAVYFKGNWKHKFDEKHTENKPFHVDKNTVIEVPTMHIKKKYYYKTVDELNAQCVKLPYENEDLEMEIIVPNEVDGLAFIEKNLGKLKNSGNNGYYKHEIDLALPKFKIKTTLNLESHLKELGMDEMFTTMANFGFISDRSLSVSKVIQKTFIEVNEEGCEAAAVTGLGIMLLCMPPPPIDLNVDKPFLYRILYKANVIFSGRIVNPLKH